MTEEMKNYNLVTAVPALTSEIKAMGVEAGEAFRKAAHQDNLAAVVKKISKNVLKKHGGAIISADDLIVVRTTLAGVEALKEIIEINRISEEVRIDPTVKTGTNIICGFSWQRANPTSAPPTFLQKQRR